MQPLTLLVGSVALATYILAIWKGDAPERLAAFTLVGAMIADQLFHAISGFPHFAEFILGEFLIDFGVFSAMMLIALKANRCWPLFCCAFALIPLLGHAAMLTPQGGMQRAYWTLSEIPVILMVLVLLIGTTAHVKRGSAYPAWSHSTSI